MFILRCQSLSDGDVKWIVGLVNLELRIIAWAEERDFKFFDKKMLFKTMSMYESSGKNMYRRDEKGLRLISKESPVITKRGDEEQMTRGRRITKILSWEEFQ